MNTKDINNNIKQPNIEECPVVRASKPNKYELYYISLIEMLTEENTKLKRKLKKRGKK
jgi:hypothetical protein